jgi:hypothetical protein
MVGFELAQCKLCTAADQDDVGAQVAGDAARRCDHSVIVSATEAQALDADAPITPRRRLHIAAETSRAHIRNAMRKFGADTRTQAVAIALRRSMIG